MLSADPNGEEPTGTGRLCEESYCVARDADGKEADNAARQRNACAESREHRTERTPENRIADMQSRYCLSIYLFPHISLSQ